jgi:hypothetical protein
MDMKAPDLTPGFMALVKAQQKADALSLKRQKERTAELKKQTKEQKAQAALAKARAVLEKADTVFNMDLIQNTAALMGKVTADETLRLKLQQAILLGNAGAAGNLAQELLASQLAAMKLSSSNPLGGFTDALKAALDGVRSLRDELAKLGAPKAAVPIIPVNPGMLTPDQLLNQDYLAALADATDPRFAALDSMRYQDDIFRRNPSTGALNVVVSIDPNAAAYGIGVASVNNSANGNSNNYSTIQSFQGGVSF